MRAVPVLTRLGAVVLSAASVAALNGTAFAARQDTTLISRASGAAGAKGNLGSAPAAISADGRHVAFTSIASNLSAADPDHAQDVYVRDRVGDMTRLVSRATGSAGVKGDGLSTDAAVDGSGRLVAFHSQAANLSPDDGDHADDVYARDLDTEKTTLVSRASGVAGAKGDDESWTPAVSAEGRYVAFASLATNLSAEDADATRDAFVRDLKTNTTTLVSRGSGANGVAADGDSSVTDISADGRFVAFQSRAANLGVKRPGRNVHVYVRDMVANTTTLVSLGTAVANGTSYSAAISDDGRTVAFTSRATNLSAQDTDTGTDIYARDLSAGTTTLVSRSSGRFGRKADSPSALPDLSADGRVVAFASSAGNLTADAPGGIGHVFVHELATQTTKLASRASGAAGAAGNALSLFPSLSGNGREIAFDTNATNLDPADTDSPPDVYVREL